MNFLSNSFSFFSECYRFKFYPKRDLPSNQDTRSESEQITTECANNFFKSLFNNNLNPDKYWHYFAKYNQIPQICIFNLIKKPKFFVTMLESKHPESRNYSINFLNSVTGFSPKTNRYYYIASGATVGDNGGVNNDDGVPRQINRLGLLLMEAFKAIIQSTEKNMDVFFIGYDPKNPTDFSIY